MKKEKRCIDAHRQPRNTLGFSTIRIRLCKNDGLSRKHGTGSRYDLVKKVGFDMNMRLSTSQNQLERGFHPPIQHGLTWFFTISNHGYIGDVLIKQGEVALLVGW